MPARARIRIVLACLFAIPIAGGPALAGCISQSLGAITVHNCNGKITTSQTVGATTVHNFDGRIGLSQRIGETTVHSLDGKTGTSQTIGDITVHSGPLFDDR